MRNRCIICSWNYKSHREALRSIVCRKTSPKVLFVLSRSIVHFKTIVTFKKQFLKQFDFALIYSTQFIHTKIQTHNNTQHHTYGQINLIEFYHSSYSSWLIYPNLRSRIIDYQILILLSFTTKTILLSGPQRRL